VVEAAGGVVVRRDDGALPKLALVHRSRYDDWSLPKGKLQPGEDHETAALREVREETGLVCRLRAPVGTVRYTDRYGRPKEVRYWLMEPVGGQERPFAPNEEVDELRWVPLPEALATLSYPHDREMLSTVDLQGP
jgi:8-oxo-dGTP diphosphatase